MQLITNTIIPFELLEGCDVSETILDLTSKPLTSPMWLDSPWLVQEDQKECLSLTSETWWLCKNLSRVLFPTSALQKRKQHYQCLSMTGNRPTFRKHSASLLVWLHGTLAGGCMQSLKETGFLENRAERWMPWDRCTPRDRLMFQRKAQNPG